MIVGERERHHQPRDEGAVGPDRLHLRAGHAQDCHLGPIHDRRKGAPAEAPQIRDRERAALHIVERQLAGAGFLRRVRDVIGQLKNIFLIHVAHNGHEQAAIGVDRDADVKVLLVDDLLILEVDR